MRDPPNDVLGPKIGLTASPKAPVSSPTDDPALLLSLAPYVGRPISKIVKRAFNGDTPLLARHILLLSGRASFLVRDGFCSLMLYGDSTADPSQGADAAPPKRPRVVALGQTARRPKEKNSNAVLTFPLAKA